MVALVVDRDGGGGDCKCLAFPKIFFALMNACRSKESGAREYDIESRMLDAQNYTL